MKVFALVVFVMALFFAILLLAQAHSPASEYAAPTTTPISTTLSAATATATASSSALIASSTTNATSTTSVNLPSKKSISKPKIKDAPVPAVTSTPEHQVPDVQAPYTVPAQSFTSLDIKARAALVNILCMPRGGTLRPISGSGVIIDARGLILTNAHVAQYILLSQSAGIDLECTVRSGSPATPKWKAKVLYMPSIWVNDHYQEINSSHAVGTGEHDYAFLLITTDTQGNAVNSPLPYVPVDSRDTVAYEGDNVLGAGYPAEFVGGTMAQQGLYAVTSVSAVKQLMTFKTSSIDVLSIGGVIEAQGGSSGGPVINAWGYVIGIISTTSEGTTTADRDLHALTLNYIDRDLLIQTGQGLGNLLHSDLSSVADSFSRETAPTLAKMYIDFLTH